MAMEREKGRFRIMMFPWLDHGHISPFLELSKNLSKTSYFFTLYLCSSVVNLESIRAGLVKDASDGAASVELVELRMPYSPELPPELHTMKNLQPNLVQAFQESSSSLSDIMDSLRPDLLVKSCWEIELKYIDYLSDLSKKKMVYTSTGPLIADASGYDDTESSEIRKWLSSKGDCSTLYMSFGSECFLSKEQIAEIAKGLLLSDVNLLWVVKFPVGEKATAIEEEFPEGFLESVKDKGLVISRRAPQTKILGHPSIGGFVSHCGWSSITESMYFGVPFITMPMQYDQPINAQMAVEAGVGVEVERDENGLYVGEEVAKAVNKVMVETAFYEGLRNNARRLSEAIREKEEGEVNEAAEQLLTICMKNKK